MMLGNGANISVYNAFTKPNLHLQNHTTYEHREREVVMDSFIRMYEPGGNEENHPVRRELKNSYNQQIAGAGGPEHERGAVRASALLDFFNQLQVVMVVML